MQDYLKSLENDSLIDYYEGVKTYKDIKIKK